MHLYYCLQQAQGTRKHVGIHRSCLQQSNMYNDPASPTIPPVARRAQVMLSRPTNQPTAAVLLHGPRRCKLCLHIAGTCQSIAISFVTTPCCCPQGESLDPHSQKSEEQATEWRLLKAGSGSRLRIHLLPAAPIRLSMSAIELGAASKQLLSFKRL